MLGAAGGAVEAVLARERRTQCSVILLTDGTTSATTVFTELGRQQRASRGLAVFEVPTEGKTPNLMRTQLSQVLDEARRLRYVSGCVTLVVVSDDPAFLTASAEWSLKGRLLTWSNKLLAVTRRPLQDLPHLYTSFSMMNAMLIILDTSSAFPRCVVYLCLPYSPPGEEALEVATWSPHHNLTLTSDLQLFPEKFHTILHRPRLVVATGEFQPHAVIKPSEAPDREIYEGPMHRLLHLLAHSLNFTYDLQQPPDGVWGVKLKNGSWTGMVGMVVRHEVDLGLGPFAVTSVRAEVVDYTAPILVDYGRIMGGQGQQEVDPWGFVMPFTPMVWAVFLAVLLAVIAVHVALLMLHSGHQMVTLQGSWLVDTCFCYVRVLLQQDTSLSNRRWWERLLLGSWMVMTLVFVRSYAGTLMSMLAVRYIPQPYQSLRDVLDDPAATMVWEADTMYVQYFRGVDSGTFREVKELDEAGRIIYVRSNEYARVRDDLVKHGRHVFVSEALTGKDLVAQYFSMAGECHFYQSREMFLPFMFAMIGQKDSPLVPALSKRIRSVTEAGLYWHWLDSHIPNSTSCSRATNRISVQSALSVTNLWGMFVVLVSGHSLALLLLCFEILVAHLTQSEDSTRTAA
ncbi:probable glutamate receptor [Panulirus ornatus]|uniref:probable glutamate receptor n=1 Tax=Panulirus ornatus TaxID=150431 RepID=UPI003A8AE831